MDMNDTDEQEPSAPESLTPKQERFCQEYLIDLNGTQAAIRAGYSEHTANEQASQLLAKLSVSARVAELKAAQAQRLSIDADTVLRELLAVATVDVTQAFDEMGALKPIHEIPEAVRRSISSLEVNELFGGMGDQKQALGLNRKVRFYDKTKALELLGKHLKLFADRMELTGKDGKAIETRSTAGLTEEQLDAKIAALMAKAKPEAGAQ